MTKKMKLSDMGTTGLVQYAITGPARMRGARTGKARAVIAKRHQSWAAVCAFTNAVNAALELSHKAERRAA